MPSTRRVLERASCTVILALTSAAQQAGSDPNVPRVLELNLTSDGNGRVLMVWTTDRPASWTLDYGPVFPFVGHAESVEVARRHHYLLEAVPSGVGIRFALVVRGIRGSSSPPYRGGFETSTLPVDTTPPQLVELDVDPGPPGEPFVHLRLNTDEPATTTIEYGRTDALGASTESNRSDWSQHLVLNELSLATRYHYRVTVTDAFGNSATSEPSTFLLPGAHGEEILGERRAWHPLTIDFPGPYASETDVAPNPFLDYRLGVLFSGPSGRNYWVPGYFDGDGNGGGSGNVWRVRFSPDEPGVWTYIARFVEGPGIAIDLDLAAGTSVAFDGASGSFEVAQPDPSAPGFLGKGRLDYVGEHYLRFGDGTYFIKTGTDSPENLLGYIGFDNTVDQGGHPTGLPAGLHQYANHAFDWGAAGLGSPDDPFFVSADSGVDSRGIIGLLNYLASQGVNSIYFLPMNLGGDGQETAPFVGFTNDPYNDTHYDISKLYQWGQVFDHAARCGILLHFVLGEVESGNRQWLDGGFLGTERKLFYRELVARFAHEPAILWNLSEESPFYPAQMRAFADYIRSQDPYNHPIGFHSFTLPPDGSYSLFEAVLGDPRFDFCSIQANIEDAGHHVEYWRERSASAGHEWVVNVDEITIGLSDDNAPEHRRRALFDVLFGGGGIEFYFGQFQLPVGGDVNAEDLRTREEMWDYCRAARELIEEELPFWEMTPADSLVSGEALDVDGGGAEVFTKPGEAYALFFPVATATGTLDLTGAPGSFTLRWWHPVTGTFEGAPQTLSGGGPVPVGAPPFDPAGDWVCLVTRNG